MTNVKDIFLSITILVWATLIGAITYAHVAFFSTFLYHLPESTNLINATYGIRDEVFWKSIHPILICSLLITLVLNWKLQPRRKLLLIVLSIYILVLAATFTYFVPELKAFFQSNDSGIPPTEWLKRGIRWERLSWIRGAAMYTGFLLLLPALLKNNFKR